jgi:hypothetical protein
MCGATPPFSLRAYIGMSWGDLYRHTASNFGVVFFCTPDTKVRVLERQSYRAIFPFRECYMKECGDWANGDYEANWNVRRMRYPIAVLYTTNPHVECRKTKLELP